VVQNQDSTSGFAVPISGRKRRVGRFGREAPPILTGAMTMRAKQIQLDVVPKDDLTPYAGEWVVLRDGRVVVSGRDSVELRARGEVTDKEALQLVPALGRRHLVL
jgi:hypothetical protein